VRQVGYLQKLSVTLAARRRKMRRL
jgi:hypothetical protein